jgi:dephospho-CoA kinase
MEADREVHRMYAPGTAGFDRVVAAFGADIVGADGVIDRRVLGAKVYGDAGRMAQLRAAIGDIPAHFMGLLRRWRDDLGQDALAVFEGVEIFENDYMRLAGAGWLVVCEPETAVRRMAESRGMTEADARQRLASSRDWHERAPFADHVFHNDGSPTALLAEVDAAVADLKALHAAGALPPPRWQRVQAAS